MHRYPLKVTRAWKLYFVLCLSPLQVMDGYDAAEALQSMCFQGLTIGVTANALSSDIADFIAHGVRAVVCKPVNVPELLDVIEDNIGLLESGVVPI